MREVRGLVYHTGEGAKQEKHKLDLYLPAADGTPFPTVMWIHGGGWMMGDRTGFTSVGQRFAECGVACAVISYRLSPSVRHPEHVRDCARAFAWLWRNIEQYGGRPDRLFIFGHSAGGHMSALLALDRRYLDEAGVPVDVLKGVVPMSGVYSVPVGLDPSMESFMHVFPPAFGTDPGACRDASPIAHLKGAGRIPMLVITETEGAPLRRQTAIFRSAVEKEGVKNIRFEDALDRDHLSIVIRMCKQGEDRVRDLVLDFIRKRVRELDEQTPK